MYIGEAQSFLPFQVCDLPFAAGTSGTFPGLPDLGAVSEKKEVCMKQLDTVDLSFLWNVFRRSCPYVL